MAKVKVAVYGTVGKCIQFDPDAGARAEAAVDALALAISEGIGGTIRHSSLLGLQVGDDHPQYAMWQAPETITGLWNFQTVPFIQGETLAEYIEDVVGGDFFDFLQDTTSVVWTYAETANELSANVPPEFVQDTVGAMLVDTASIDLSYNDLAGTLTAVVLPAGVDHNALANLTVGDPHTQYPLAASSETISGAWAFSLPVLIADGTAAVPSLAFASQTNLGLFKRSATEFGLSSGGVLVGVWLDNGSGSGRISVQNAANNSDIALSVTHPGVAHRWQVLANGTTRILADSCPFTVGLSDDLSFVHDGTDSYIRNDTGELRFNSGATTVLAITAARADFRQPLQLQGYTVATLPAGAAGDTAYVTDALAPVFLGAVAGGGAVTCTVFFNGAAWVVQ